MTLLTQRVLVSEARSAEPVQSLGMNILRLSHILNLTNGETWVFFGHGGRSSLG